MKTMPAPRTISGPKMGAGMMPAKGPGPAAAKKTNRFGKMEMPQGTTSGSTPRGMKTYAGR